MFFDKKECPFCGTKCWEKAKFCSNCGVNLVDGKVLKSANAVIQEFVDLVQGTERKLAVLQASVNKLELAFSDVDGKVEGMSETVNTLTKESAETQNKLNDLTESFKALIADSVNVKNKLDDISGKVNVLTRDDVDVMISFMRLIAANQLMMELNDFEISPDYQLKAADLPKANSGLDSLRAAYADKQVSERFAFGRYSQGANGEVMPITWRVLRRDGHALLAISEYGLDAKPYNKKQCSVTWSDCTLRSWLNGDFLQKAFNAQEQSLIKTSRLANNAGPATDDRVFLLSIDEAKSLFSNNKDRIIKPTDHAIKNNVYVYNGNTWWWLRSRGNDSFNAARVGAGGVINNCDMSRASGSVRPALCITI